MYFDSGEVFLSVIGLRSVWWYFASLGKLSTLTTERAFLSPVELRSVW